MKKLLVIACILIGTSAFAQKDQTSPVWPGCGNSKDVKACFNKKLAQHVRENYVYPKNDDGQYVRGKVTITFTIDENGDAVVNSVKGDKPAVNQAAKEMILKIPHMKPGTLKGEPDDSEFTVTYKF